MASDGLAQRGNVLGGGLVASDGLTQRGDVLGGGHGASDGLTQRRDVSGGGLGASDGLTQRRDVSGGGLRASDSLTQRRDVTGGGRRTRDGLLGGGLRARHRVSQREDVAGGGLGACDGLAQRGEFACEVLLAHRLDAGAQPVGLALQLVQAAAVVAGQALGGGALDGQAGELLADGVGAALDLLDALQRGGELGAGGLTLALAVALEALERGGELLLGGLRLLLVLRAQRLELGRDVGAGEASFEAAGGFGDRLDRTRFGGGDSLGQAAVGQRLGGRAVALQLIEAGGQARVGGLGARERGAVGLGALQALQAGELLVAVELGRDVLQRPLDVGAQGLGLTLCLGGALLGVAAGLVELGGQAAGDALELVDALDGAEQARDDRRGVVEVAEVALDARVGVREALFGLGVLRRRARPRGGPVPARPTASPAAGGR